MGRKGGKFATASNNPFAVKKTSKRAKSRRKNRLHRKSNVETIDKEFSAILSQSSLRLAHKDSVDCSHEEPATIKVAVTDAASDASGSELSIKDVIERTQRAEIS